MMQNMPLSKTHKARSRRRILSAASTLFCRHGYSGAGINAIMEAAELTRGAFYAHFESKEELFTVVVGGVPPLLERLQQRGDRHTHHLVDGAVEAIRDALSPDKLEFDSAVGALETLAADVARADIATRFTYAMNVGKVADELMRGFERDREHDPRALAALSLIVGGWAIARASSPDPIAHEVLAACADAADAILRGE